MIHPKGEHFVMSFVCILHHRHRLLVKDDAGRPVTDQRLAEKIYFHRTGGPCPDEERKRLLAAAEAERIARARQAQEDILFPAVSARYLSWAAMKRPKSVQFRKSALGHADAYFMHTPFKTIGSEQLEAYMTQRLAEGAAPATVNRERAVLSHLFTRARLWKLATANPVRDTEALEEPDGKPRPVSLAEQGILTAHLPTGKRAWPHWHDLVELDVNTGLRLNEWRKQAWRDIDLVEGVLRVTEAKSQERDEVIPLNATATAILARLPRVGPRVFPDMPTHVSDLFARIVAKAKLPEDITFHCLRDTFISRVAPHVSQVALMQLARHRDFRTTRRYLRVDRSHLRPGVEALDRLSPGGTLVARVDKARPEVLENTAK